jgi:PAS domain S-box-containing protein
MAIGGLDELIRSRKALPDAAILTELITRTFIVANDLAGEVFGTAADDLVRSDVLMRIHPDDRKAARAGYAALAAKVIDGYQVQRRIVRPDGIELIVSVSGRRVGDARNLFGLWILVPGPEPPTHSRCSRWRPALTRRLPPISRVSDLTGPDRGLWSQALAEEPRRTCVSGDAEGISFSGTTIRLQMC